MIRISSEEDRDFLLWRYFHQDVNPQESSYVQKQLAENSDWLEAFEKIRREEQQFALLETEQPSLRFTKNVMESIEQKSIVRPAGSYINTHIVKWIGGGFIATIILLLIYTFSQVQWTAGTGRRGTPSVQLPALSVNWNFMSDHRWLYGCFTIVVVCLFVLAERFQMNRRNNYQIEQ